MSSYTVTKALQMLRCYWKVHLSIMLQMAAGIAVIYASVTIYLSISTQYEKLLEEIDQMNWNIIVSSSSQSAPSVPPLDYEQYLQLKETYQGVLFPLYVMHKVYFPNKSNQLEVAYFLYTSDDFMRSMFKHKGNFEVSDKAYAGTKILANLQTTSKIIPSTPYLPSYTLHHQHVNIDKEVSLPVKAIHDMNFNVSSISMEGEEVSLENIMILPLVTYYDIYNWRDKGSIRIDVNPSSELEGDQATSLVMQVLDQLYMWNGDDYAYRVSTPVQVYLLKVGRFKDIAILSAGIAGLCLIIVGLGLIGLIHVLFQRRMQEIAISLALGAGKRVILKELYLESALPSLIGGMIGTVSCAFYISAFVHFESFELIHHGSVIALSILFSGVPGILCVGSLFFRIRCLKPLEILRRE